MKIFSIRPYEDDEDESELQGFDADSFTEIRQIVKREKLITYHYVITEWDVGDIDLYGCPAIVAQCNLEVALDYNRVPLD